MLRDIRIKSYIIIIGLTIALLPASTTFADLADDVARNPESTMDEYNEAMSFCNGQRNPVRIKSCIDKLNRGYRRFGDSWLTTSAPASNNSTTSSSADLAALQAELETTKQALVAMEQQLTSTQNQLNSIMQEKSQLESENETLEHTLSSKQDMLSVVISEKQQLEQQLSTVQSQHIVCNEQLDTCMSQ